MRAPIEAHGTALWVLLAVALALAFLGTIMMGHQAKIMKEAGGPGIVPFEKAGTTKNARAILSQWGEQGQAAAKRNLAWDFVFILGYGLGLSVLVGASAVPVGRLSWPLVGEMARWIAWLVVLAALLDVVENWCLFRVLAGANQPNSTLQPEAHLARACALWKFGLVEVAIVWLLLCVLLLVWAFLEGRPNLKSLSPVDRAPELWPNLHPERRRR
jgi:hypothetical protein